MMNALLLALFIGLAASTSGITLQGKKKPHAGANPEDLLIFVCNDGLKEICTNMCFGAYCKKIGQSMQYDKPDSSTKRNRRHAAGCIAKGGNRCSVKKGHVSGFQCDEYPFASSIPKNGASTRLNRCVPAAQNRKQGGIISAFYKTKYCKNNNGGKCNYEVKFSNAGGIKYCDSQKCNETDNEEVGPGGRANSDDRAEDGTDDDQTSGQKKRLKSRMPNVPVYRTSSGLEVDLPGGATIGQRAVLVLPRNVTLFEEHALFGNPNKVRGLISDKDGDEEDEGEDYEYMMSNFDVREDIIEEEIVPTV